MHCHYEGGSLLGRTVSHDIAIVVVVYVFRRYMMKGVLMKVCDIDCLFVIWFHCLSVCLFPEDTELYEEGDPRE